MPFGIPGLTKSTTSGGIEIQRRALISRSQLKSDQPCLASLPPDCSIVIEEDGEQESCDRKDKARGRTKADKSNGGRMHVKLNEDETVVT
jgi:hypothetical protein